MHVGIDSTFNLSDISAHLLANGTAVVRLSDISAHLLANGTAVVRLGDVSAYLHTPAECDALITAAVEAKRLLSPPAPEPACQFIREYDGQIYPCVLGDDHADEHQDRLAARWWHGDDDSQTVTHAAPKVAGQGGVQFGPFDDAPEASQ